MASSSRVTLAAGVSSTAHANARRVLRICPIWAAALMS